MILYETAATASSGSDSASNSAEAAPAVSSGAQSVFSFILLIFIFAYMVIEAIIKLINKNGLRMQTTILELTKSAKERNIKLNNKFIDFTFMNIRELVIRYSI
ncbi:UNVERIFIED_CONTAM: hypothetical protein O8I53_09745 [Campylobacter lari]